MGPNLLGSWPLRSGPPAFLGRHFGHLHHRAKIIGLSRIGLSWSSPRNCKGFSGFRWQPPPVSLLQRPNSRYLIMCPGRMPRSWIWSSPHWRRARHFRRRWTRSGPHHPRPTACDMCRQTFGAGEGRRFCAKGRGTIKKKTVPGRHSTFSRCGRRQRRRAYRQFLF